ncbi:MAG: hypothetical protein ACON38_02920, partial [Akkermansiaceae bacterium]
DCTASPKQPIAQDPVGAPRLELFFDGLLQDLHPEHGIGIHLLELGVLLLKGFEPFGVRHLHHAEFLALSLEGGH